MNRAQRRAHAATQARQPLYGRPVDLLRQLAALGVAAKVRRAEGRLSLDWIVPTERAAEVRAVRAAFPSDYSWGTDLLSTFVVLAGDLSGQIPAGFEVSVPLAALLAAPPRDRLAQKLLAVGVRQ